MPRHQQVENCYDAEGKQVEDAEAADDHGFGVVRAELFREGIASLRQMDIKITIFVN